MRSEMKLLALIAVLFLLSVSLYANGDDNEYEEDIEICFYQNKYEKSLRVPKDCAVAPVFTGELYCKAGKETFRFFPMAGVNTVIKETGDEVKEAYGELKKENPDAKGFYQNITFWKMNGNKINFIEGKHIAAFYVDTPSRFRFVLDNHKGTINLELTDPNMVIEYNKPPKNSRSEYAGPHVYGETRYYIKDAIRI
jgi:hypothetical protein